MLRVDVYPARYDGTAGAFLEKKSRHHVGEWAKVALMNNRYLSAMWQRLMIILIILHGGAAAQRLTRVDIIKGAGKGRESGHVWGAWGTYHPRACHLLVRGGGRWGRRTSS